jgi:hypothetical protein
MNEFFGKACDQAWSAYYALKHDESMSWAQVRQVCSNLSASLDYLARAAATQSDTDVLEIYAEAKADTAECLKSMTALYDSIADDKKSVNSSQYRDLLKLLYWL